MRLIKFSRPGCNPCVMVGNYLNELNITPEEVNVYEEGELANKYHIQTVPVLLLLDDEGNPLEQVIGYNPDGINKLLNLIQRGIN